jgi:hypothetical protein
MLHTGPKHVERRSGSNWLQYALCLIVTLNFGLVTMLYIDDVMSTGGIETSAKLANFRNTVINSTKLSNFKNTVINYANQLSVQLIPASFIDLPECNHTIWCEVTMPSKSFFNLNPPSDRMRWRQAQLLAASDAPVLLEALRSHFPSPEHFLGDNKFRGLHLTADVFINRKTMFSSLTADSFVSEDSLRRYASHLQQLGLSEKDYLYRNGPPGDYVNKYAPTRAPIVYAGYNRFVHYHGFFSGPFEATTELPRSEFLAEFALAAPHLTRPAVFLTPLSEESGWLSPVLSDIEAKQLKAFLDHDKTLLLVIHQHISYFSSSSASASASSSSATALLVPLLHPKIMVMPLGTEASSYWRKALWDTQRAVASRTSRLPGAMEEGDGEGEGRTGRGGMRVSVVDLPNASQTSSK